LPLVETMRQPDALQAKRVLVLQLIMTLLAALFGLLFGLSVALSVLVGAGVCLLANASFAFWVFRGYRAQEPGRLLVRFYAAEIGKILMILGLFAVSFVKIEGLHLPALLVAYLIVQVMPPVIVGQWDARTAK